ncbi:MAG: DUF3788 domain-containing protein [bacterium]|nr:DUF3788 domain-containing protein [bacterium]
MDFHQGKTAFCLYDCPPAIANSIYKIFSAQKEMIEGESWYQEDHGLFLMNQRPALAITSERFMDMLKEIVHTPKDSPEIIDTAKKILHKKRNLFFFTPLNGYFRLAFVFGDWTMAAVEQSELPDESINEVKSARKYSDRS